MPRGAAIRYGRFEVDSDDERPREEEEDEDEDYLPSREELLQKRKQTQASQMQKESLYNNGYGYEEDRFGGRMFDRNERRQRDRQEDESVNWHNQDQTYWGEDNQLSSRNREYGDGNSSGLRGGTKKGEEMDEDIDLYNMDHSFWRKSTSPPSQKYAYSREFEGSRRSSFGSTRNQGTFPSASYYQRSPYRNSADLNVNEGQFGLTKRVMGNSATDSYPNDLYQRMNTPTTMMDSETKFNNDATDPKMENNFREKKRVSFSSSPLLYSASKTSTNRAQRNVQGRNSNNRFNFILIGSSGGGAASFGKSEVHRLVDIIRKELSRCDRRIHLTNVLYVEHDHPLDSVTYIARQAAGTSTLWMLESSDQSQLENMTAKKNPSGKASLEEINREIREYDNILAKRILEKDDIDGIIAISSDPLGTNKKVFEAAALKEIPVVVTGGTSLGKISKLGCCVVGNSGGSVATSIEAKAVCYVAGLAGYLRISYQPHKDFFHLPDIPNICGSLLPSLMAIMLCRSSVLFVLKRVLEWQEMVTTNFSVQADSILNNYILSIILSLTSLLLQIPDISTVLCTCMVVYNAAQIGEGGYLAGITAGMFLMKSSTSRDPLSASNLIPVSDSLTGSTYDSLKNENVLKQSDSGADFFLDGVGAGSRLFSAILTGCLCAYVTKLALLATSKTSCFSTTSVTIITVGISGVVSGLVGRFLLSPVASFVGTILYCFKYYILLYPVPFVRLVVGFFLGILIFEGSKTGGLYHKIILPLILLEMEEGHPSLFGAFDVVCLVNTCLGICASTWCIPLTSVQTNQSYRSQSQQELFRLAKRGLFFNFFHGDFIEACYPMIESDETSFSTLGAYLGAGISGGLLLLYSGIDYYSSMIAVEDGVVLEEQYTLPITSSAYLPIVLSFFLSKNWHFLYPLLTSFFVPFLFSSVGRLVLMYSIRE